MNASSFITFFTYMLRQNITPFRKELYVAFKMAPNIKKHSLYFSTYRSLYKGHSCILKFCNARFGTCAEIVSYLSKYLAKWYPILVASLSNNSLHGKVYITLFQSRVNRHVCDVINFMLNVILSYLLVM